MSVSKAERTFKEINRIPSWVNALLTTVFSILIFLTCIYPLLIILGTSFTDNNTIILNGYNMIPKVFDAKAYSIILEKSEYLLRSYGITIFVTAVGTLTGLVMMAMYAYPLSRKDLKYRKFFSMFMYITFVFNGGLVPFYYVYSRILNLGDTIAVLIIPYLVDAWYVIILKTFFTTSVPISLIESAKIDGAGEFRIFTSIVIKLATPGLATVALFTTLKYWNDFQMPLYFIDSMKKYNIQYLLYRLRRNLEFINQMTVGINVFGTMPVEAARMAMCVLGVGPMLIAYPFFQKYVVQGLTMGAVKG